ncbi:B3 domain-containing transcription factor VRN1-like [Humulus lupulus]|uniref:B3 domain-containing transcription factor VRN1-like n=1 Tax=Humulus lupulus TaxID=3486 RepID=UPI002B410E35|nr:B3 domain-containing transcription factor VRN1-like [Humulus lupulus]
MACASQRAKVQTNFSPMAPHFFKIILEENIGSTKLQIPKTFWMKYCGSLSSQVFLKLPCGSRWEVGLTKSDGKVWIEKGWENFAQHCSLSFGHLLVFRYEGKSQFNVIICDKTTVEIDYPSNPNLIEKHVDTDDDVSIEVLDNVSWHPKTRVKSPLLPCSQPHKKMRRSALGKVMQKGGLSIKVESGDTIDNTTGLATPKRLQKLSSVYRNTTALERSIYFQSEYPFFIVIMKASYVTGRGSFYIPAWFAETYINKKECEASLWISNGKSWSVYFKVRFRGGNTAAEFINGWKAFAHENSLEVGDICKFELTQNDNGISFRVSCVKGDDDAYDYLAAKLASTSKQNVKHDSSFTSNDKVSMISHNIFLKKEQEKNVVELSDKSRKLISEAKSGNRGTSKRPSSSVVSRVSEAGSHFSSKNPSFQVVLQPSHVQRHKLPIPLTFARHNFGEKAQIMTLCVGEEYWNVKLLVYESEYTFSAGWALFARENSLQPRDVCIFELIKRNQPELKVSIIRQSVRLLLPSM